MRDLEETGFVENSATLKTVKSGVEESLIQYLGDGDRIYITATPLYNNSDIDLIVLYRKRYYRNLETKGTA